MADRAVTRVELGAIGGLRPPADATLRAVRERERQGFDAVWWADHLLHWFPTSIWSADLVPQAARSPTPHVWFDPFPVVAAAGAVTERLRLAVGVTDLVRTHPVQLARTALTLDHLTGGRFILGVGTGEALNLAPIGLANEHPLSRLIEAVEIMRTCFAQTDPFDYAGDHFRLEGAVMGLAPSEGRPPPIWMAAHRPRGLAAAGRLADGWFPLATTPADYARMLQTVAAAALAAGRPADAIVPGLYARCVIADDAAAAIKTIDESLLMRFIAIAAPAETYRAHGAEHPLGAEVFGGTDFVPSGLDRSAALALAARVPEAVVREVAIHGTPDDIAARLAEFAAAGARHIQLTNLTPLADPTQAAASEALLGDAVTAFRARVAHLN